MLKYLAYYTRVWTHLDGTETVGAEETISIMAENGEIAATIFLQLSSTSKNFDDCNVRLIRITRE